MSVQLLIAGIDPGATTAYAVIDLDGKLVIAGSEKKLGFSALLRKIIEQGRAVIVATDKKNAPRFVSHLATAVGARLITPTEDMSTIAKKELVKEFNYKNVHEKDAIASAAYAYKQVRQVILRARRFAEEEHEEKLLHDIISIVLKDEKMSVRRAIELAKEHARKKKEMPALEAKPATASEKELELKSRIKVLQAEIRLMRFYNENLKAELLARENPADHKKKINPEERAADRLRFKEGRLNAMGGQLLDRERRIKELGIELHNLNRLVPRIAQHVLVKKLPTLGYNAFLKKNKILQIKEKDIVMAENPDICSNKTIQELKGVISFLLVRHLPQTKLLKDHFTVIDASNLEMIETANYALIRKETAEGFKAKPDLLKSIVDSYRMERKSE